MNPSPSAACYRDVGGRSRLQVLAVAPGLERRSRARPPSMQVSRPNLRLFKLHRQLPASDSSGQDTIFRA